MSDFHEQPIPPVKNGLEALLFVGGSISRLSAEQLEAIECVASSFGIEMRRVQHVERELGEAALGAVIPESEPEPVPVDRKALLDFAGEHGYSAACANRSWVGVTAVNFLSAEIYGGVDPYPPVKWLAGDGTIQQGVSVADLWSIKARLVASDFSPEAWPRGIKGTPHFLGHMVNVLIRLDDPLLTDR